MSDITLKLTLNKGRHGIPVRNLAKITQETEKFLESFGDDVHLDNNEWLADDFKNGSLEFNLNYTASEKPEVIGNAKKALLHLTSLADNTKEQVSLAHGLSQQTVYQFARIAHPLEAGDSIGFSLPNQQGVYSEHILTKERATRIERETSQTKEVFSGIQGYVSAMFRDNYTFWLVEKTQNRRIVCSFPPNYYKQIWRLLDKNTKQVNVEGWMEIKNGVPVKLRVVEIAKAVDYKDGDLDKFFGCDPDFTGDLSTKEYFEQLTE